jgi:glyoxylase-like metal-dependent hydrolase (beta-lactamase superfamily II)
MTSLFAKTSIAAALLALAAGLAPSAAANGVKRLYALDCGRQIGKDQSRWTPDINAGKAVEFSNNCYIIQHERGTLLWETGLPDSVAAAKDGLTTANGAIVMFRDKTLMAQLAALGLKPDQIDIVAVSHAHGDHVGNLKAFAKSKILMQKAEVEFAKKMVPVPIAPGQNVVPLSGDHDVFGDGSVTIISTPGHTPGHQSLLVKLPKTGAVILSGDLVHLQLSWEKKLVPAFNFDKNASAASIERVAQLLTQHKAQLWIGHDKANTMKVARAPQFHE